MRILCRGVSLCCVCVRESRRIQDSGCMYTTAVGAERAASLTPGRSGQLTTPRNLKIFSASVRHAPQPATKGTTVRTGRRSSFSTFLAPPPVLSYPPFIRGPCFFSLPPHLASRVQVMGEKGMLSLGNPPSSGLELLDSQGCSTSPPEHSFPQRFREVCYA